MSYLMQKMTRLGRFFMENIWICYILLWFDFNEIYTAYYIDRKELLRYLIQIMLLNEFYNFKDTRVLRNLE